MKSSNHTLVLTPSLSVPKQLHDDILGQIFEISPALAPGVEYTLQDLCDAAFWDPLTDAQRRIAGRVMVHLVKENQVPLRFADYSCRTPKRYTVKI